MPFDDCSVADVSAVSPLRMESLYHTYKTTGERDIAVGNWPIVEAKETVAHTNIVPAESISSMNQNCHSCQQSESAIDVSFRPQVSNYQRVIDQIVTQRITDISESTVPASNGEKSNPFSLSQSLKNPRKSLPLLPRISQYERHPLLQVRPGSGLSEFELFLLEKELFKRKTSVDDQWSQVESTDHVGHTSQSSVREQRLIPRSAHYEPHPLLRKSVSGVCELELYLFEKEKEVEWRCRGNDSTTKPDDWHTCRNVRQTMLEPRSDQWEQHALLEIKDETGLSEMERLFIEIGLEEQKDDNRIQLAIPSSQHEYLGPSTDEIKTSESPSCISSIGFSLLPRTKVQQKRVRFERQKIEADDSGIASSDTNQSGCRNENDVIFHCNKKQTVGDHSDECDDREKREQTIDEHPSTIKERRTDTKNIRRRTNAPPSAKKYCCLS